MASSGSMVMADDVSGVSYPECRRCDVVIEQTGAGDDEHGQVIDDTVAWKWEYNIVYIDGLKVVSISSVERVS